MSRWCSVDPILENYLEGKPNGGVYNPVNTNLYNYCANNPVKYVDPDGQFWRAALFRLKGLMYNPYVVKAAEKVANSRVGKWIAKRGGSRTVGFVAKYGNKFHKAFKRFDRGAGRFYDKVGQIICNIGKSNTAVQGSLKNIEMLNKASPTAKINFKELLFNKQLVSQMHVLLKLISSGKPKTVIAVVEKMSKTKAGVQMISNIHALTSGLMRYTNSGKPATTMKNLQTITKKFLNGK